MPLPTNHQPAASDATACNHRGLARCTGGDPDGALADFQAAIALRPDYPEAWNNAGMALQQLGRPDQAAQHFNRALALRADYADALNNRGRLRHVQGDPAGAARDFDHALCTARGPAAANVFHNRGTLRLDRGDVAAALSDFDEALEIVPDQVVTLRARAAARKAATDLAGAMADLDRALALTPAAAAAPVLHERGGVRLRLNDWAGAIADYDRALAIDPTYWLASVSRGHARYHQRDFGGLSDYRRALRLDAEGTIREVARMALEDAAGDADGVLRTCAKHLRIDDRDAVAVARRCLTLSAIGRSADAADELEQFRTLVPDLAGVLGRILDAMDRAKPAGAVEAETRRDQQRPATSFCFCDAVIA